MFQTIANKLYKISQTKGFENKPKGEKLDGKKKKKGKKGKKGGTGGCC